MTAPFDYDLTRDRLRAALDAHARGLSEPQINDIVDFVLDPDQAVTVKGIQRVGNVSKPTARRYRNILLAALEQTPEQNALDPTPSDETVDRIRAEAELHAAQRRAEPTAPIAPTANSRVDAQEVARIIDRQIRRLDAAEIPNISGMKQLLDLKIRFEELEHGGTERKVDSHKTLGPNGLPGMLDTIADRFRLLIAHRREVAPLLAVIIAELHTALSSDKDISYLGDEASALLSSPFWTPADAPQGDEDQTSVSQEDASPPSSILDPAASPPWDDDTKAADAEGE